MNFFLVPTHSQHFLPLVLVESPICSLLSSLIIPTFVQTCPTLAWTVALVSSSVSLLPSQSPSVCPAFQPQQAFRMQYNHHSYTCVHVHTHTHIPDKSFSGFPHLLPEDQISLALERP